MLVYGAKTPLGRRTMVWRLKSLSSSSLMRAQMPSPKSVPLGTTTAARPGLGGPLELAHDELEEEQSGFGGLLVFGEVAEDAALFFAAEGRVGHDDIDAVSVADLAERKAKAVQRIDLRRFQAVQNQVHLGQQIRKRLRLAAEDALGLENLSVLNRLALLLQMLERLDEKAAGAAGRIENHFAELRIDDFDHEADDGTRGVELAGVAGGVAHLFEHGLVEMAEGVDLVAAGEVDVVDFVDHVAEQIAVDHAVDRAFEDGGDDVAPVAAVGALQAAQIGEQARPFGAVRTDGFFVIHEGDQLVAGDSFRLRRPIAPAIRRFESRTKALAAHLGFLFANLLHVVEEFEKHDPGEHRQAVQVAVEPFVLAHDVAAGLDD